MPGVTVSLSGPSLMTARTTMTDQGGAYRFSAVPTGDHTLTFELAGFATLVREGIHVGRRLYGDRQRRDAPGRCPR